MSSQAVFAYLEKVVSTLTLPSQHRRNHFASSMFSETFPQGISAFGKALFSQVIAGKSLDYPFLISVNQDAMMRTRKEWEIMI